ncbi:MAG: phage antirepressor Ant, partial [Cetobacterium sp.]
MNITTQKKHISSLELIEQINIFRKEVEGKSKLQHKDLMKVIRDEFEDEIAEGIISPGSYKEKQNQSRPLFHLSINEAKQVLVRESKAVRRAIIKQLEEYEKGELTLTEKQK